MASDVRKWNQLNNCCLCSGNISRSDDSWLLRMIPSSFSLIDVLIILTEIKSLSNLRAKTILFIFNLLLLVRSYVVHVSISHLRVPQATTHFPHISTLFQMLFVGNWRKTFFFFKSNFRFGNLKSGNRSASSRSGVSTAVPVANHCYFRCHP